MKEKSEQETPQIIAELNQSLKEEAITDMDLLNQPLMSVPTVESIAAQIGISENMLHDWLESDVQFARDLHGVKESRDQLMETFPELKWNEETGLSETYTDATMITLLLLETKDRHYKSENQ